MTHWPQLLKQPDLTQGNWVLVTVGIARGSTPRNSGTRMLVCDHQTLGTIGGGQLELQAILKARKLLSAGAAKTELLQLPLGPELSQCCGGYAEIMLERLTAEDEIWLNAVGKALNSRDKTVLLTSWQGSTVRHQLVPLFKLSKTSFPSYTAENFDAGLVSFDQAERYSGHFQMIEPVQSELFHLYLFGAGHVGRAIVHTLAPLPICIHWIDPRETEFPTVIPNGVQKIITSNPPEEVHKAVASGYFLVMTHSHQLDFDLTAEILNRQDAAYLGLIGSKTKRNRFFKRFEDAGFTKTDLQKVTCPIGITGTGGKHPNEIAISVSAEILQLQQRHLESRQTRPDSAPLQLSVVNR